MCKSTPLKALKTRYFSNHQKLLPIAILSLFELIIACFKPILACLLTEKTL